MEVIICTPDNSGHLVNQTIRPLAPARGHEKGDRASKSNSNEKNKKSFSIIPDTRLGIDNLGKYSLSPIIWVGAFVAISIAASFMSAPKAHAADQTWGSNVDLAKKVINNVAPIVSDVEQDGSSASLVFAPEDYIQKPLVVETQITPEPPKSKAKVRSKTVVLSATAKAAAAKKIAAPLDAVGSHIFPYGYCTYFVAQKRGGVPWSGNAGTWLSGARSYGFATGGAPQVGAIMVTSESPVGHVAYVEAVNGDIVTVSEMNYKGFGIVSSRTLSASSGVIKGFIY